MDRKQNLTKSLAVIGAILVWFPLLLPFLFGGIRLIETGKLNIDFLIPAEIFYVPFIGSVALLWAAVRARSRRALIGWSFAAMLFFLIISLGAASVTGLASGRVQEGGWQSILVFGLFGGFLLAMIILAVGGINLLRDLYQRKPD